MESDWTGGHSGNWKIGANWQSGVAPGPTDDAVVQGTGSTSYTLYVSDAEATGSLLLDDAAATLDVEAAASLALSGTLAPSEGTLTLAGTLAGGSLTGSGELYAAGGTLTGTAVSGTLTLAAPGSAYASYPATGTLSAANLGLSTGGALQLQDVNLILLTDEASAGATLTLGTTLDGADTLTVAGHTLTLGSATVLDTSAGGTILGGTLVNEGTISALGPLTYGGGRLTIAGDSFVQAGTFTASSETLTLDSAEFVNTGTLSLASSTLMLAASAGATNTGVIAVGFSAGLTATSDISGSGTLLLGPNSSAEVRNVAGTVQVASNGYGTLQLDAAQSFTGTIAGFSSGEVLSLQGLTAAPVTTGWAAGTLTIGEADGSSFNLLLPGAFAGEGFALAALTGGTATGYDLTLVAANCFARGTRILARRGEVPVETLSEADEVWSPRLEAWRPVLWVGRRRLDCRRHPDPDSVRPVRIPAGALGEGRPARDLVLSPDHGLFVSATAAHPRGALVPARLLLGRGGATREPAGVVEYFHVEVAGHDVLLAEGVAAETFLDDGSRAGFANGAAHLILHPELARRGGAEPCAPYAVAGATVAALLAGDGRPWPREQRGDGVAGPCPEREGERRGAAPDPDPVATRAPASFAAACGGASRGGRVTERGEGGGTRARVVSGRGSRPAGAIPSAAALQPRRPPTTTRGRRPGTLA